CPTVFSTQLYCVFSVFFFSSRRRHTRFKCDWSSDVCSSDLPLADRFGVIGTPEQCAARLAEFRDAGCTYFLLNAICEPPNEREQIGRASCREREWRWEGEGAVKRKAAERE